MYVEHALTSTASLESVIFTPLASSAHSFHPPETKCDSFPFLSRKFQQRSFAIKLCCAISLPKDLDLLNILHDHQAYWVPIMKPSNNVIIVYFQQ